MNFIGNETEQKLRGGYYTPLDLAVFLARWVKGINPKKILEPSCGDGVFFNAFEKIGRLKKTTIVGFEINKEEAQKARVQSKHNLHKTEIYSKDFLQWAIDNLDNDKSKFDAIIGNPPFIRYQYLPATFQMRAEEIFAKLNLPFTKHTNAWVPFLLASMALLRPGGRLAMVVPAEIIHILHAQSLRSYLGSNCSKLVIIDPEELWFDNTLQGAVLLLAEKLHNPSDKPQGVGIYPVKGRSFLQLDPEDVFSSPRPINGKTVQGKWTRALLDPATLALIDDLMENANVHPFKDIADVDVGIVTGANDYFLVSNEIVEKFNLSKWAYPMFGRSDHCPGIIYDEKQHKDNIKNGKPTNFIWFKKEAIIQNPGIKAYIKYGEQQKLHLRYKCSVRSPWYSVPSVYSTDIGMLKRSHNLPRLILNKVGAFTTDTAYRIKSKVPAKKLVSSFINSLTALSAELEGRHYGGGVLELVPSEIENLLIPLSKNNYHNLSDLDKSIRELSPEQTLQTQDRFILGDLGISRNQQNQLFSGWVKLRDRRQRISD